MSNYKSMKKDELIALLMERDATIEKAREAYGAVVARNHRLIEKINSIQQTPAGSANQTSHHSNPVIVNGKIVCSICGSGISNQVKDYLDRNPGKLPKEYVSGYLCVPCQRDPEGRKAAMSKHVSVQEEKTPVGTPQDIPASIEPDPSAFNQDLEALKALMQSQAPKNNGKAEELGF